MCGMKLLSSIYNSEWVGWLAGVLEKSVIGFFVAGVLYLIIGRLLSLMGRSFGVFLLVFYIGWFIWTDWYENNHDESPY